MKKFQFEFYVNLQQIRKKCEYLSKFEFFEKKMK